MIFRTEANMVRYCVPMRGLDPTRKYRMEDGTSYSGSALMQGGVLLPRSWGDYYPVSLHFVSE